MIEKLLIANRGEIAVRIIRAARELGVRTVAVYSEADERSLHVAMADEAVPLGPPEPPLSYLDMEKIIVGAKATGADAIHPGYGFLSERAEFSERCEAEGLVFVGPPASAMRALGSKIDAKQLAVSADVPVTPGFFEPGATKEQLAKAAAQIGYPVLLKASAGGGGRGMRVVESEDDFKHAFDLASQEAVNAFGDGAMMVEKLIQRPRHVELQVLADAHGNVSVLFERECSLQRRHQKLVEEAPAPALAGRPDVWERMRSAAERLVRAAGYRNAGTLEFLFDDASGDFYFMEVNARLQVEHPVTEAVTGVDLVHQQLRIASGLPLALGELDRSRIRGHSIEARIVAEDPAHGFLPSTGRILAWAEPRSPGVRVDTGFGVGAEVTRFYDSLLAKVIVHAETRDAAIARMVHALQDFHILGVKTNIGYLLDVLAHADFQAGNVDTGFLGREFGEWENPADLPAELGALVARAQRSSSAAQADARPSTLWDLADGFRVAGHNR